MNLRQYCTKYLETSLICLMFARKWRQFMEMCKHTWKTRVCTILMKVTIWYDQHYFSAQPELSYISFPAISLSTPQ